MNEDKEPTIDVARRILAELSEMTEHASLTHGLRGGERAAAQAYNRVLDTFTATGVLPGGMFVPVDPETAEYGPLGVQCRLLLSVVSGGRKKEKDRAGGRLGELVALAPFLDSEDLGRMVMERLGEKESFPDGLLVGLAPFLDSRIMGQIVRRGIRSPEPPQTPAPPEPPKAPEPSRAHETVQAPLRDDLGRSAETLLERRPDVSPVTGAEAPNTLESLAAELRRPDLTMEERQRIAMRLAELSYEQAAQA